MTKSTFQTAVAIANSSIGSAMIIFPLNYLNFGIIENLIFLILMGVVLATTCSVYGMHLRPSEKQITQIVKRVLGQSYFRLGALLSGILITLVSALFFLLASDILYDVFDDIFGDQFFSEKGFKIILMFGFAGLSFFQSLDYVFKFSPIAMGALILSTAVLIFSLPFNFENIDSGAIIPKQFSFKDVLIVASINGFAFTCHPSISPMIKENGDQAKNKKAIYLGFAISATLYFIVGVCGSLSIYGKTPKKPSNVMDYFAGEWQALVIGFANFIYFVLIFPIFPYVGKDQLISLLPNHIKEIPRFNIIKDISFCILWLGVNIYFILTQASAGAVMGFLGSIVSFYFTYFLPVMIMLKAGKTVYIESDSGKISSRSLLSQDENSINASLTSTDGESQDRQMIQDGGFIIRHYSLKYYEKVIFGAILGLGITLFISQIVIIILGFIN